MMQLKRIFFSLLFFPPLGLFFGIRFILLRKMVSEQNLLASMLLGILFLTLISIYVFWLGGDLMPRLESFY